MAISGKVKKTFSPANVHIDSGTISPGTSARRAKSVANAVHDTRRARRREPGYRRKSRRVLRFMSGTSLAKLHGNDHGYSWSLKLSEELPYGHCHANQAPQKSRPATRPQRRTGRPGRSTRPAWRDAATPRPTDRVPAPHTGQIRASG